MHSKIITQIKRYVFIALVTPASKERAGCMPDKSICIRHDPTRQAACLCFCTVLQPGLFQNVSLTLFIA